VWVPHILELWDVTARADDLIARGSEQRLRGRHGRTHNSHPPDAGNDGPDNGHLLNLGEHDYSSYGFGSGRTHCIPRQRGVLIRAFWPDVIAERHL
jgi:hypothetical protein